MYSSRTWSFVWRKLLTPLRNASPFLSFSLALYVKYLCELISLLALTYFFFKDLRNLNTLLRCLPVTRFVLYFLFAFNRWMNMLWCACNMLLLWYAYNVLLCGDFHLWFPQSYIHKYDLVSQHTLASRNISINLHAQIWYLMKKNLIKIQG